MRPMLRVLPVSLSQAARQQLAERTAAAEAVVVTINRLVYRSILGGGTATRKLDGSVDVSTP